jgi:hypothetical protein
MTQKKPLTGPELEALGLMKFTCDTCRKIFPVRCEEHRVLVAFEGNHQPQELTVKVPRRVPKTTARLPVLQFGRPIAGYDAPYEVLEADISAALRASSR